jgi:senataxin
MVTRDLVDAKLMDQSTTKTLSDIHPAVVYRMVCNWTIFSNPKILSAIYSSSLIGPLLGWPTDPLPPGMFVLLMSDRSSVRQWAVNQALQCTTVPMSDDLFVGSYLQAIEAVVYALTLSEPSHSDHALKKPFPFSVARDPSLLWSGFSIILRHIPVVALASNTRHHVDIRHIVTGHLHDTGPR